MKWNKIQKFFFSFFVALSFYIGAVEKAHAQWVYIPDANFRNAIAAFAPSAIAGDSLDTTNVQIINKHSIGLVNLNISDLTGIQYFDSLRELYCGVNHLTFLPPLPTTLTDFRCESNLLTTLPSLPSSIIFLDCDANLLTALPTLPSSLTEFDCQYNSLDSLPPLPPFLRYLSCYNNSLTSLPSLPPYISTIDCGNNLIRTLPALPSSLTSLYCYNNKLTSLPALPSSLSVLDCYLNLLTSLPSLPSSLSQLYCYMNALTSLPSLPVSLTILSCHTNLLPVLPSLPSSLTSLYCSNNVLTSLPTLPSSLNLLYCGTNSISCLPLLPESLRSLNGSDGGFTCLPNKPPNLTNIAGPSTLCASIALSDTTTFCHGDSLILSGNGGSSYLWNTGVTSQSIVVKASGTYSCAVTTACGILIPNAIKVTVNPVPAASFSLNPDLNQAHHYIATNNSTGASPLKYYWSWGDGTYDSTAYPTHVYAAAGLYTICLTVTDSITGCANTFCDSSFNIQRTADFILSIDVVPGVFTGNPASIQPLKINFYPNPAKDELIISSNYLMQNGSLTIYNAFGETIESFPFEQTQSKTLNIKNLSSGIYFMQMKSQDESIVKKFIKE